MKEKTHHSFPVTSFPLLVLEKKKKKRKKKEITHSLKKIFVKTCSSLNL